MAYFLRLILLLLMPAIALADRQQDCEYTTRAEVGKLFTAPCGAAGDTDYPGCSPSGTRDACYFTFDNNSHYSVDRQNIPTCPNGTTMNTSTWECTSTGCAGKTGTWFSGRLPYADTDIQPASVCALGCFAIVAQPNGYLSNQWTYNGVQVWRGTWQFDGSECNSGRNPTETATGDFHECPQDGCTGDGTGEGTGTGDGAGTSTDGFSTWCAAHPDAPTCKVTANQASGGEGCTTPPSCAGDAIQCAILYQQWATKCRQVDGDGGTGTENGGTSSATLNGCTSAPVCSGDPIQCAILATAWEARCQQADIAGTELGQALDGTDDKAASKQRDSAQVQEIDLSTQINLSGFLSRSCPSNTSFTVMGAQLEIPWSDVCWAFQLMGNVALAFCLLAGARIALVI